MHETQLYLLPAVEKLTVPRHGLQPLHPDTGASPFAVTSATLVPCSSCLQPSDVHVWEERVSVFFFFEMSSMKGNSLRTVRLRMGRKSGRLFIVTASSLRPHRTFTSRMSGPYLSRCRRWKRFVRSTFTSGKKNGRYLSRCRYWKRLVHSTFTSRKKSGRLFHVMTSMASLIYEVTTAESSDKDRTCELPVEYII